MRIASLEIAFRMQFEAQEVLDLSREPPPSGGCTATVIRNACLMARRLAERGVRMTQIYFGNGQPWDDHADILIHRNHAKQSDQAIAALLDDLKQRGLWMRRWWSGAANSAGRRLGGPEGPRPQ